MFSLFKKSEMPAPGAALPGRAEPIPTAATHFVSGRPLKGPHPEGMAQAMFGMGCFWGVERMFWKLPGVWVTAAGYAAGRDAEPDLPGGLLRADRAQRGGARHLRPERRSRYEALLQGVLGGPRPDAGHAAGQRPRHAVPLGDLRLRRRPARGGRGVEGRVPGRGCGRRASGRSPPRSSTRGPFYYAEDYHQQYLAKNPGGYCGIGGTGVSCPIGAAAG